MEDLAASYWNERTSIKEQLLYEAYNFEFYQAVKLLEIIYLSEKVDTMISSGNIDSFDGKKVEEYLRNYFENETYRLFGGPVVFKSNINPSFPASDLERVIPPVKEGAPYGMLVNFMGVAGLSGPLPEVYTQMIINAEKDSSGNTVFKDFLDIFNNHLIYLMYKVRRKCRVEFDIRSPADTDIAGYMFSLIGMGPDALRNRLSIKDHELLYYVGLLANHNRSISGIEFILSDYLKVKVSCQPLQGNWQKISEYQQTEMGPTGRNQILGQSAILGSVVWDQNAKFLMRIGPVSEQQFIDFLPLPVARSFRPLYELTRQYIGSDMIFETVLIVNSADLKGLKLKDPVYSRLGWTSWLPLRKNSIYDYKKLFFIESKSKILLELENGKRLKLGWTVWVPDATGKIKYIEVRVNSSVIEMYI